MGEMTATSLPPLISLRETAAAPVENTWVVAAFFRSFPLAIHWKNREILRLRTTRSAGIIDTRGIVLEPWLRLLF